MISSRFGDMSRQLMFGRQNLHLKTLITTLSEQMTTGKAVDVARHLHGNMSVLAGIEASLTQVKARSYVAQNASTILGAQQSVIGDLSATADKILDDLLRTDLVSDEAARSRRLAEIHDAFSQGIRQLNMTVAGRSLFAGSASEGPAIAAPDVILSALLAELPPLADPYDLSEFVDAWFAPGSGFDAQGYMGSGRTQEPFELGHGIFARIDITAQDHALRRYLASLAKGALFHEAMSGADHPEKRAMLNIVVSDLTITGAAMTDLAARLGMEEGNAALGASRAEAEQTTLMIARADLVAVDPYEAASQLEQTMSQLEMIYTLTSRLSRLSLADYLR